MNKIPINIYKCVDDRNTTLLYLYMKVSNHLRFVASVARRAAGITQRELDYWDQIALVRPSVTRAKGKGTERVYSYIDLVKLRVVKELRANGLSLQRIRKAIRKLTAAAPSAEPLLDQKFITDGKNVFVQTADPETLQNVLSTGQLAFSVILLGKLEAQVRRRIHFGRMGTTCASA